MKTLLPLILLACLPGLAQTAKPAKAECLFCDRTPTTSGSVWAPPIKPGVGQTTGTSKLIYTTTPVASNVKAALSPANVLYLGGSSESAPFRLYLDAAPDSFVVLSREGKPLVRCISKTQTCEVIK